MEKRKIEITQEQAAEIGIDEDINGKECTIKHKFPDGYWEVAIQDGKYPDYTYDIPSGHLKEI